MTLPTTRPEARPEDVGTIDSIVKALYESISFTPGTQPDYNRLRSLFHPQGYFVPPRAENELNVHVLDVEAFITRSREHVVIGGMERKGFVEKETARRLNSFGSIAQLFSTYESRHTTADSAPLQRGINSIQLIRERSRWWIISVVWDVERPTNLIPKAYLT